jgi:hypothetical protein
MPFKSLRLYRSHHLQNRLNLIEVMEHGQVCNKHPFETHHMHVNETQMFACSVNRRGLSDDKREKSHIWHYKIYFYSLRITFVVFECYVFNKNCRKSRTNKISTFLQSGVWTKYLWFASKFLEPYGWQRSDVNNKNLQNQWGTRWLSSWGTALQTGRSRDGFPIVSLEFFIGIILPAALWHWGRLSL